MPPVPRDRADHGGVRQATDGGYALLFGPGAANGAAAFREAARQEGADAALDRLTRQPEAFGPLAVGAPPGFAGTLAGSLQAARALGLWDTPDPQPSPTPPLRPGALVPCDAASTVRAT